LDGAAEIPIDPSLGFQAAKILPVLFQVHVRAVGRVRPITHHPDDASEMLHGDE
jgi:hypothetical protein